MTSSHGRTDDEHQAKHGEDIIAWAEAGQEARAEDLAERLAYAIEVILESRLQGQEDNPGAKRDILFDLYEREIFTRDQVRTRGRLDPPTFWEELHAYRQRRSAR